jgi:hypothetical protein
MDQFGRNSTPKITANQPPPRRRCAPESWAPTEHRPPVWNEGRAPTAQSARQRLGLGERARPRAHQHASPRADSKNERPQAGGSFNKSGARRTRQRPWRPHSLGPCGFSSMRFPRHRLKRSGRPSYSREATAPVIAPLRKPHNSSVTIVAENLFDWFPKTRITPIPIAHLFLHDRGSKSVR